MISKGYGDILHYMAECNALVPFTDCFNPFIIGSDSRGRFGPNRGRPLAREGHDEASEAVAPQEQLAIGLAMPSLSAKLVEARPDRWIIQLSPSLPKTISAQRDLNLRVIAIFSRLRHLTRSAFNYLGPLSLGRHDTRLQESLVLRGEHTRVLPFWWCGRNEIAVAQQGGI
jgi:hypothetical protein